MLEDPSTANCMTYNRLNKEVKQAVRRAKKDTMEKKVQKVEEDHRRNDSHNLFKSVRELEGKPKKALSVLKDQDGKKHFSQDKILQLWKEHFERHLNTSFTHEEAALQTLEDAYVDPDSNNLEINKDEVRKAINKLKNKKAPGIDTITAEVIKAGGEEMVDMLLKIFNNIWNNEKSPRDFSRMIVTPVYKKGDRQSPENFRAISLLSIPGKIFLRIMLGRMQANIGAKLRESQFGFREGRGTVDAIFIVRQIIEKANERKIPLNFHFIDFKAAFDTIWREALWKMMKATGINPKIINIVRNMYENTQCSVIYFWNLSWRT